MKRSEIVAKLIISAGYNKKTFAEKIGLPNTTLQSILKRGIGGSALNNVKKIVDGLGISIEELNILSEGQQLPNRNHRFEAYLSSPNHRSFFSEFLESSPERKKDILTVWGIINR